jgi:predicted AlkP superfamily phosphohydrolase/phosphomutase
MGRTVVAILEGVSTSLVERWMPIGALPSFKALADHGTMGAFKSVPVPYEGPALVSSFTGVPPGEHGCFSYWHVHGTTYGEAPRVIAADDITAPFLWQTPAAAALRVGIVNLFGTHPPSPVHGHLISYPFYPTVRASYPQRLLRELSQAGIRYGHDVSALYTGTPREEFYQLIERVESARMQACFNILERGADLCVFNITMIDRLSHFWWSEVEANSGMADDETILWRAYQMADRFIAQLMDTLGPEDTLIVFSEIGFGPLVCYVSVNEILRQAGLLAQAEESVDPTSTIAMEAVQGSHGINLNLRQRYPNGLISDAEEAAQRHEVRAVLLAAINPDTRRPLFKEVVDGQALYPGSQAGQAPDLVLVPEDERYLPLGDPYWANKVHRHLQTGWHRCNSFWAGLGPRFSSRTTGRESACMDIAQTIADCLGLPPPSSFGSSLASASSSAVVDRYVNSLP